MAHRGRAISSEYRSLAVNTPTFVSRSADCSSLPARQAVFAPPANPCVRARFPRRRIWLLERLSPVVGVVDPPQRVQLLDRRGNLLGPVARSDELAPDLVPLARAVEEPSQGVEEGRSAPGGLARAAHQARPVVGQSSMSPLHDVEVHMFELVEELLDVQRSMLRDTR